MRIAAFGASLSTMFLCEAAQLKDTKLKQMPGDQVLAQECSNAKNLWVKGDYMIPKKPVDSYQQDCKSMRNPIDPVTGKRDDKEEPCGVKSIEIPTGDTPEDKKKLRNIFKKLDKETDQTISEIKKLGGVSILPPNTGSKQCCCWGTPIGDKLLALADDLDRDGMQILAQVAAEVERSRHGKVSDDEIDFGQIGARSGGKKSITSSDDDFINFAAQLEKEMQAVYYGSDPNLAQSDSGFDPIAALDKLGQTSTSVTGDLPKPEGLIQTEVKEPETPLPKPDGMAQAKAKAKAKSHGHGHHDHHPHFLAQQDDPNYFNYMAQQDDGQLAQAFGQVQGIEGVNDPYAPDFCFAQGKHQKCECPDGLYLVQIGSEEL